VEKVAEGVKSVVELELDLKRAMDTLKVIK
jgi:hypothetical protein